MIKIPSISQVIKDKHWAYTKSHIKPLLEEYRIDPEISDQERNLYNDLLANDCYGLKMIILGLPSELRSVVNENAEGTFKNIPLKSSLEKQLDYFSNKDKFGKKKVFEILNITEEITNCFPQNQTISDAIDLFKSALYSSQETKNVLFAVLKNFKKDIPDDNNLKEQLKSRTILHKLDNTEVVNFIESIVDVIGTKNEIIAAQKTFTQSFQAYKSDKILLLERIKEELIRIKEENNVNSFHEKLSALFDYNKLVSGNKFWGAYQLVQGLDIPVCPYCNRSFISIVENEEGKTRPELDHFYPKSKYPYLALSIYNLIPSCHICNSNFKGDNDFYKNPHCHPYEDSLHKMARFKMINKLNPIDQILNHKIQPDDLEIQLLSNNSVEDEQLTNSKTTFQLEELYNYHKDTAIELSSKSLLCSPARLIDLEKISNQLSEDYKIFDDVDFGRLILGNYTNIEDFNKRPLAKFTYDIADQVDLLQNLGIEYKEE